MHTDIISFYDKEILEGQTLLEKLFKITVYLNYIKWCHYCLFQPIWSPFLILWRRRQRFYKYWFICSLKHAKMDRVDQEVNTHDCDVGPNPLKYHCKQQIQNFKLMRADNPPKREQEHQKQFRSCKSQHSMTVSWQSIQDCKLQQCNTHAILAPGSQTVSLRGRTVAPCVATLTFRPPDPGSFGRAFGGN